LVTLAVLLQLPSYASYITAQHCYQNIKTLPLYLAKWQTM